MAVAAFSIHAADPLSKREPALLYLLIYTILFFKGSGRYSLSYFVHNRAASSKYAVSGLNKN
jgi:putative oxidoreductase